MQDKKQLEEALSYFQKYSVYEKLFFLMKQKYASLGRLGGTFELRGLTLEEQNTLSGFMGIDFAKASAVKISYAKLKAALRRSRFGIFTWEEILTAYYGVPLSINKEVRLLQKEEKDAFLKSCLSICTEKNVKAWLTGLLSNQANGYRIIEKQFASDARALLKLLHHVIDALEHLPVKYSQRQLLPVFSAEITGNPHYFDDGTSACNLLLNYGTYRFGQADAKLSGIEQRESILYQMGIIKDDLSNTCLAYGITGRKENGCIHEGLQGFANERQALQITLNTLSQLTQLATLDEARHHNFNTGRHGSQNNCHNIDTSHQNFKIYILENPAVFSYLTKKYPLQAFLCTTGQLKLASYAAMDLFPETYTFYYAGDFDPEGLQIAQSLKKRYGKRLILWNYTKEHYKQAMSDLTVPPHRLKKLDKIDIPELLEIKQCLLTETRAAYQERMLDTYIVE